MPRSSIHYYIARYMLIDRVFMVEIMQLWSEL